MELCLPYHTTPCLSFISSYLGYHLCHHVFTSASCPRNNTTHEFKYNNVPVSEWLLCICCKEFFSHYFFCLQLTFFAPFYPCCLFLLSLGGCISAIVLYPESYNWEYFNFGNYHDLPKAFGCLIIIREYDIYFYFTSVIKASHLINLSFLHTIEILSLHIIDYIVRFEYFQHVFNTTRLYYFVQIHHGIFTI